jgi:hypothetical protein
MLLGMGTWAGAAPSPDVPQTPAGARAQQILSAVSAHSSNDLWAVGYTTRQSLIRHWNGTGWKTVKSPSPGVSESALTAVSTVSGTDAWAVGYYYNVSLSAGKTLTAHWDGSSWKPVDSPNPARDNNLFGVAAVSAADAWAVGRAGGQALILHWNGTAWKQVAVHHTRTRDSLQAIAAIGPKNIWAVGKAGRKTLTMHWNGTSWKTVKSPNPAPKDNFLAGVSATSAHDVWAVGTADRASRTLVLHWNGRRWKPKASPNPGSSENQLLSVSARARRDAWAVGYSCCGAGGAVSSLSLHWNGHRWHRVRTPNPSSTGNLLNGVTARGVRRPWAVGDAGTRAGGAHVLALRWNGKRWRLT